MMLYDKINIWKLDWSKIDKTALPNEMSTKEFVWKIMDGSAVEISKEKFEEMKQKYIAISKLAKNGTEN